MLRFLNCPRCDVTDAYARAVNLDELCAYGVRIPKSGGDSTNFFVGKVAFKTLFGI